MKTILAILSTFLLGACNAPSAEYKSKVITSTEVSAIQTIYEKTDINSIFFSNGNPYWNPEFILPKIHSWFSVNQGLRPANSIAPDYVVFELRPIPDQVLAELDTVLLKERYSLSILTASFWHQIQEAQKKGLQISFFSLKSKAKVMGVFFYRYNLIGLNIFSDPVTLPHELRHKEQYKYIDMNYSARFISNDCLSDLSRAFGEIDAITYELPYLQGIVSEFDNFLKRHESIQGLTYPQNELMDNNTEYGKIVTSDVLKGKNCSEQTNTTMRNLNAYFSQANVALRENLNNYTTSIVKHYLRIKKINSLNCHIQSNEKCLKYQEEAADYERQAQSAKESFEMALNEQIKNRRSDIKTELQNLDQGTKYDLCKKALGFSFFINCKDVL